MAVTKSIKKLPKIEIKRTPIEQDEYGDGPLYKVKVKINGRERKPNRRLKGVREKYLFGNFILKVEIYDACFDQVKQEKRVWKRLTDAERKYFPETFEFNVKQGYTLQKKIKMRYGAYCSEKKRNIVRTLAKKYNLTDVMVYGYNNWALCAKTGNPVIYDFGY